jgi:hypothetical protein
MMMMRRKKEHAKKKVGVMGFKWESQIKTIIKPSSYSVKM